MNCIPSHINSVKSRTKKLDLNCISRMRQFFIMRPVSRRYLTKSLISTSTGRISFQPGLPHQLTDEVKHRDPKETYPQMAQQFRLRDFSHQDHAGPITLIAKRREG